VTLGPGDPGKKGGSMKRRHARRVGLCLAGLVLALAAGASAQDAGTSQVRIRTAFGAEYFNRQITWDSETYTSKLNSLLFTFSLEVEPLKGLSVTLIGGYSMDSFNGLVFRQLPFSIDLETDYLSGLLVGGGLRKNFVVSSEFEMDLEAEFVTYLGSNNTWTISGLNEDGTLTGKARWYRIQAGPVFWYKGFMYFSPYVRVTFDKLWGTFSVEEDVGPLAGLEDKPIDGQALFSLALGTLYEPGKSIGLKGEVFVLPRSGGLDYGARGKIILSF
jgi:hypothetical protein